MSPKPKVKVKLTPMQIVKKIAAVLIVVVAVAAIAFFFIPLLITFIIPGLFSLITGEPFVY
ncbi:hypothetical protein K9N08_04720 [Candidatus Gracilibacteria bacterium]|nr:hypothetical protein [Candidatus Gracilibacteria bacterium]MCF7897087.1 hypothetical protein [Candidatus Gracilibacteria bacterium]